MEQGISRYKQLVKDIGVFGLGTLGSKLLLFFLVPLYTTVLSTSEYGIAEFVITTGQLLMPFISLSISSGLFRFGLLSVEQQKDAFFNATVVLFISSLVLISITPLFGLYKTLAPWKWYLSAYVIVTFASSNNLNYLKVKNRNKLYAGLNIINAILLVVFNVLFLLVFRKGIEGYLLSVIISTAFVALLAFLLGDMLTDLRNAHYNKCFMKEMIVYSMPLIVNGISWWLIHSSDKVMVEVLLGAASLGLYSAAAKIPSLIAVFIGIFNQAWRLAAIKEYDSTNDSNFYSHVFRYYSVTVFGACIIIISLIKIFMGYYVSSSFFEAWHYVPLLILSSAINAFSAFTATLLEALKKSVTIMSTTLVSGIVNIFFNFLLIPMIGLYGASLSTFISYILISSLRMRLAAKHIDIDYSLKNFVPILLIVIVHTVFVTMDFHIYAISVVCILLFTCICYDTLSEIFHIIYKKIRLGGNG